MASPSEDEVSDHRVGETAISTPLDRCLNAVSSTLPSSFEDATAKEVNPGELGNQSRDGFSIPKKTIRSRLVENKSDENTMISGPMFFSMASPAVVMGAPESPRKNRVQFVVGRPEIHTHVVKCHHDYDWVSCKSQPSRKRPHVHDQFADMKEAEKSEYNLLDKWAKHYHALLHSSGDATVDCD